VSDVDLLADRERRRQLVRNAREVIRREYDIETVADELAANLGLQSRQESSRPVVGYQ